MIEGFIDGIVYNIKGIKTGLKNPKLLLFGILRLLILVGLTIIFATFTIAYHEKIMSSIWIKPKSIWIVWIWHFLSWLLTMFLIGISTIISYVLSQIFFSVLIMDYMSKLTEKMIRNKVEEPNVPFLKKIGYLIQQEIPRTFIPITISFIILIAGWLTPVGPFSTILSFFMTTIFLSWDNTDLVPARRFIPFKKRLIFLIKNLPFHIGFGLFLVIPVLNNIFFSFAPIGATMYYLEVIEKKSL